MYFALDIDTSRDSPCYDLLVIAGECIIRYESESR
jgi:hypothetical protein